MHSVKTLAKSFALNPIRYTKINNVFVIDSDSGLFVLKPKLRDDLTDIYTYLNSRGFTNFLTPKSNSDLRYDLYPYLNDNNLPNEQKITELATVLGSLHAKTSYYKEVDLDDYKKIYEYEKNDLNNLRAFYEELITGIESEEYMSPSAYLLARNINKIMAALSYTNECLEKWYEKIMTKHQMRLVRLNGKADLDHFITNASGQYLINWNNSFEGVAMYDVVHMYRTHYLICNLINFIEAYEKNYVISEDEWLLLCVLVAKPNLIYFLEDEYQMCTEVSKLVDYVYRTEQFILTINEVRNNKKTNDKTK